MYVYHSTQSWNNCYLNRKKKCINYVHFIKCNRNATYIVIFTIF